MNKILYNSLFLGIGTAVVAIVSYAVSPAEKPESEVITAKLEIPAFQSESTTLAIKNPVLGNPDEPTIDKPTINKIEKPIVVVVNNEEDIHLNKSISHIHQVKKEENLSSIFYDLDLTKTELHNIIHANEFGKQFASISPGKKLYFTTSTNGQLQELIYHKNSIDTLKATRVDDGFEVNLTSKPLEERVTSTTLAINNPDPVIGNADKPTPEKPTINKIKKTTIVTVNDTEDIHHNNATRVHQVKKGESLSTIFYDLDLTKTELHNIIHANELGKQFATISPGKKLYFTTNSNGELQELIYHKNSIDTLKATRVEEGFEVNLISKPIVKKIASTQATINSSLFLDGKDAGLSDKLIMQLAEIFAWDIDFALSLRQGDQFTVVYEKIFVEGEEVDTGNIIAAEFVNQDHPFTAVKFEDGKGNISYFTPDGKSMRKAFLRTPVNYARISSHFNLKRKHPVLNKIRAHKGVDYAAKTGTAIKTTGDGKIIFRGRKGGYGRVVIVKHGQKYSTLYAHMSSYKKGQKVGNRVKQGQIIGYVGKSGLATGPHLHYEFRVNGVHRNPLTVKLPHAKPIKKSLLAEFKKQTRPLIAQLNKAKANTLLAQN